MKKWVCPVCGYVHEGDTPPEKCPVCKVPGERFTLQAEAAGQRSGLSPRKQGPGAGSRLSGQHSEDLRDAGR